MVIAFLPLMFRVNFSYINKITLFCRKNSSWTSKTVGWRVWARHQMAFIRREFDPREKTGCQGTSEYGFAICCPSSSAFLFAECKYIRTCVWLTARTKVHFCKSHAHLRADKDSVTWWQANSSQVSRGVCCFHHQGKPGRMHRFSWTTLKPFMMLRFEFQLLPCTERFKIYSNFRFNRECMVSQKQQQVKNWWSIQSTEAGIEGVRRRHQARPSHR